MSHTDLICESNVKPQCPCILLEHTISQIHMNMGSSAIKVTVGGEEYIPQLANLLALAFLNDPVARYYDLIDNDLPNTSAIEVAKRVQGTSDRLKHRIKVGPHLVEAGDWAAGAVW